VRGMLRRVLCLAGMLAVAAGSPAEDGLGAEVRWADPSWVRLKVEFPGEGYHADWELFRCSCGDLLVRSELDTPGDIERGETLLVGGVAVLSRGFADSPELGSSLDAPALMMQLALRLLERAQPAGPSAIGAESEVALEEKIDPIYLESYSATGVFRAPWSLSGTIAPTGDTGRRFDLQFDFTAGEGAEAQHGTMRLKGQADFAARDFPVSGADSLEGWNLSWRGDGGDTAPAPATDTAATLDELREEVRRRQTL
jgi:hypothetical protein